MKKAGSSLGAALLLLSALAANSVLAQRGRPVSDPAKTGAESTQSSPTAPQTVRAKYEGGVLGYNKKMDGTLFFDDENRRLLFRNERQQQVLFIPYDALLAAFADTQSRRPTAATVISQVPLPYGLNLPAMFVRKKYRYMTLQYKDPDTQAAGITSFKLGDKAMLDSVVATLATKAGLVKRGEAFLRRSEASPQATSSNKIRMKAEG